MKAYEIQAKADTTAADANADAAPRKKTRKREPVKEEPYIPGPDDVCTLRTVMPTCLTWTLGLLGIARTFLWREIVERPHQVG